MPAYRFLYEKRRISGPASADASTSPVTIETNRRELGNRSHLRRQCLVAYLMSRDQSHPLKEAKSPVTLPPAPGKGAK